MQLLLESQPAAAGQSLIALDFLLAPIREFAVIAGDGPDRVPRRARGDRVAGSCRTRSSPRPRYEQAGILESKVPLLADRPPRDGRTTTYICEHFACQAPVLGVDGVEAALGQRAATP